MKCKKRPKAILVPVAEYEQLKRTLRKLAADQKLSVRQRRRTRRLLLVLDKAERDHASDSRKIRLSNVEKALRLLSDYRVLIELLAKLTVGDV